MKILILGGFANYENRVVKRYTFDGEYVINSRETWGPFDRINFKPRDGITTNQVVNVPGVENFRPDYLVTLDEQGNVLSRWYVIEANNTRGYQYDLSLVRDIIADHWDEALDAKAIVARGWTNVTTGRDTPIYNSEGFNVSQVKVAEQTLKDKTGSAWVVGFMKNAPEGLPANITWRKVLNAQPEPALLTNVLDNDNGFTVPRKYNDVGYKSMYTSITGGTVSYGRLTFTLRGQFEDHMETTPYQRLWQKESGASSSRIAELASEYLKDHGFEDYISSYYEETPPYHFSDELEDLENTYFVGANDRIYKLKKKTLSQMQFSRQVNDQTIGYMASALRYAKEQYPEMGYIPDNWDPSHDTLTFWANAVQYSRDYVTDLEQTVEISQNRAKLNDRPWSMCAIPVGEVTVKTGTAQTFTTQQGIAETFAAKFTEQVGENCIDVQLLPYCPIPDFVDSDGVLDLTRENEGNTYSIVKNGSTKTSILLWARESSAHITIPYIYVNPLDPIDFKVEQEAKLYRLAAPNYSSAWDFSPTKNNGISCFDVDFTYEPNGSYIRVAPRFGGLYGQDFGDSRGLIITTNTSLPRISDAWVNYQLNNANYQKIFDRQIQTMEFNRNIGIAQAGALGIAGGIGALGGGAIKSLRDVHSMTSDGGVDASIKAMLFKQFVGKDMANAGLEWLQSANSFASTAAINTAFDVIRQNEAIKDAHFTHEMQLANIQAQPQTITQIGAFNINNKLFPVLEIYDATDEEKENIRQYITYRSMNIGRTTTIRECLSNNERTWIEASLVNTVSFLGDAHELATLKSELQRGVYIYE